MILLFLFQNISKVQTLINQRIIIINKFILPFYFSQLRLRIYFPVFFARLLLLSLLALSHRLPETNSSCRSPRYFGKGAARLLNFQRVISKLPKQTLTHTSRKGKKRRRGRMKYERRCDCLVVEKGILTSVFIPRHRGNKCIKRYVYMFSRHKGRWPGSYHIVRGLRRGTVKRSLSRAYLNFYSKTF